MKHIFRKYLFYENDVQKHQRCVLICMVLGRTLIFINVFRAATAVSGILPQLSCVSPWVLRLMFHNVCRATLSLCVGCDIDD